jgi:glycosyltransferase involved in cell wall biosynthesis
VKELIRPRVGCLNQYSPRELDLNAFERNHNISSCLNISVVTPSFNQGRFIESTILSVIKQSYPNIEYIIMDGASSDNTVNILEKYQNSLKEWVSEPDSGQSNAINKGMLRTTGEIMCWLNSDDLLLPGALHTVVSYFDRHPDVDIVYGNRLMIDENGMEIGRWVLPGHDNDILSWADYIPQETLFWRRRVWDKVGAKIDESYSFAMDWDLLVRFRDVGAKFAHIPQFLGAFRIHEHQKTSVAINEIGNLEMTRIRERTLGKVPSRREIHKALLPYLAKHVAVDLIYRVKKRLGVKT